MALTRQRKHKLEVLEFLTLRLLFVRYFVNRELPSHPLSSNPARRRYSSVLRKLRETTLSKEADRVVTRFAEYAPDHQPLISRLDNGHYHFMASRREPDASTGGLRSTLAGYIGTSHAAVQRLLGQTEF